MSPADTMMNAGETVSLTITSTLWQTMGVAAELILRVCALQSSARSSVFGGVTRDLVGVELVDVPDLAEGPPHLLHHLHLFERGVQRIGGCRHRIQHGMPRGVGGIPCFFASGARRLGCDPRLLAGDARRLSRVS